MEEGLSNWNKGFRHVWNSRILVSHSGDWQFTLKRMSRFRYKLLPLREEVKKGGPLSVSSPGRYPSRPWLTVIETYTRRFPLLPKRITTLKQLGEREMYLSQEVINNLSGIMFYEFIHVMLPDSKGSQHQSFHSCWWNVWCKLGGTNSSFPLLGKYSFQYIRSHLVSIV